MAATPKGRDGYYRARQHTRSWQHRDPAHWLTRRRAYRECDWSEMWDVNKRTSVSLREWFGSIFGLKKKFCSVNY